MENDARLSFQSVAPTVIALGAFAGLARHAFRLLFAAATTTTTPACVARAIMSIVGCHTPLYVSDMLITAGWGCARTCAMTQSMACSTLSELPPQPRTCRLTICAWRASPIVSPAASDATAVPCPAQSPDEVPPIAKSGPSVTRPPNSWCDSRMPVSST